MADWRARLVWRVGAAVRPPVTLGVRCLVVDATGAILLVRHTYTGGWHLPGGAVDPGESAVEAATREVAEETGLTLAIRPELRGLYFNRALGRRDHVALFVALGHPPVDAALVSPAVGEIAATRLVPLGELPADLTPATRRRIDEVVQGTPPTELW